MFRKMRRHKQELSKEECVEILNAQSRGVLAVLGDDEYPYTVPMDYVYVDGKLYFHAAMEGHKIDSIRKHEKVSFCVLNDGVKEADSWWYTFKSVIAFGKIRVLNDDDEKKEKLTYLGNKYFPTPEETEDEIRRLLDRTAVFELNVEHMTGKLVREK